MAALSFLSSCSVDELYDYLLLKFDEEVARAFKVNKIGGSQFMKLSSHHFNQMVPAIGDVVDLQSLQKEVLLTQETTNAANLDGDFDGEMDNSSFTSLPHDGDAISTQSDQLSRPSVMSTDIASSSHSTQSWVKSFRIPRQFSLRTMAVLNGKEKASVTSAVRSEIICSVSTLVMVHTMYPTPDDYTMIASQLVKEYTVLADSFGCGFTTWRNKLREKFKNLRKRKRKPDECEKESKRPKDDIDYSEHQQHLSLLKEEMKKKKAKAKNIRKLLMLTYTERRRWIVEDGPSVVDVIRQYPPLRIQRWVRHEFSSVTAIDVASVLEDWKTVWEPKIIKMGENEKETSKALKNKLEEHPQQCISGQCLTILEHLFYPRNVRGKKSLLYYIEEECLNIEEKINEIGQEEAYIICDSTQYHMVVDSSFMYSTESLADGLLDLMCYYFILNIKYPKSMHTIFIFLQHFVLGIKDSTKLPTCVITVHSKLF